MSTGLIRALHILSSHSRGLHPGAHDTSLSGSSWSHLLNVRLVGPVSMGLLELVHLLLLLVLYFLFDVLVSLEKLVVFDLTQLQSFIEVSFQFFLESVHLVLLLLDELGLGSDDLLMSLLHVLFSLNRLQLLALLLDIMSILILLLLREICLDLLLIQEHGAEFECERKLFLESLSIAFDLLGMSIFKFTKCLSILFLGLQEILVPLLVEFLILLDVSLLTFVFLLSLIAVKFTSGVLVILTLELGYSVFGHFGFHVFALLFALFLVLLENSDEIVNIF
jgi:hypothetical protein